MSGLPLSFWRKHDPKASTDREGRPDKMISAVIVTYNSSACVGACLASLASALPDAEVLVIDNDSQDETLETVQAAAPSARIIRNRTNLGFARASNRGAAEASGLHLLFLNPDVVINGIERGQLNELLECRPFGLVAPALEGEGDRLRSETSVVAGYLSHTFGALRPREWRYRERIYRGTPRAWVSGALLLVARDEFLELGGFDPRFFLYYEDQELSLRYRHADLPIRTTAAIRGTHAGGTSSASDGLRVEPMAWSLLSWIEFLWMARGEQTASRCARATLVTLRVIRVGAHGLALLPWKRARRKKRQLDGLLRAVSELTSGRDADYCPNALHLLRGDA
jgi:N-acetylglucosaminyl-diphospho-decaprenol L-rhamnosyltransferase